MKNLILAVDDEPLYLRLLKVNLEPEGFEVITTTNGEQRSNSWLSKTAIGDPGSDDA